MSTIHYIPRCTRSLLLSTLLAPLAIVAASTVTATVVESEGADLPSCEFSVSRAAALRPSLQSRVSAEDRALAMKYLDGKHGAVSEAQAWNDVAAGAALLGRHRLAAWAGLEAVAREWSGLYVANAGVFLLGVGEHDAGLAFLNCAYAMGHRSPYLFEALAAAHFDKGGQDEATRWIGEARQAAPEDTVIEAEASVITTGKAPRAPGKKPDVSPLDQCLSDLEKRRDRVVGVVTKQVKEAERLKWDQAPMMAIRLEHLSDVIMLEPTRQAIGRARMSRDEFRAMLAQSGNAAQFTEPSYRAFRTMMHNSALSFCIQSYFLATDQLLRAAVAFGVEIFFWPEVLGVPSSSYAREIRARESKAEMISRKPHRYRIVNEGPLPDTQQSRLRVTHPAWLAYVEAKLEADIEHWEALDLGFGSGGYRSELGPPAERKWCSAIKPAYEAWSAEVDGRYSRLSQRYDKVAARLLWWGANQVLDARNFARRYLAEMSSPDRHLLTAIELSYANLAKFIADDPQAMRLTNIPAFLAEQARDFLTQDARDQDRLQSEAAGIARRCTPATMREALGQLTDEELKALLEELNRQSFREDLTTDVEFKPHCDVFVGIFSASVDHTGKVTRSVEGLSIATEGSRFAGASIEAGAGTSGSVGIAAGKGGINVIAGVDAQGEWNADIEASGSLGLGLIVPEVAGGACYPGSASATIHGRQLIQSDIMMEHVRAVLANR